jgi:hypothetical protein
MLARVVLMVEFSLGLVDSSSINDPDLSKRGAHFWVFAQRQSAGIDEQPGQTSYLHGASSSSTSLWQDTILVEAGGDASVR